MIHERKRFRYDIIALLKRGGPMGKWDTKIQTSIGGQALIEGILMRGPSSIAIAVRKPDSSIAVEKRAAEGITKRNRFLGLPFVRGTSSLVESLIIGVKALTYSSQFYDAEEEPGRFERWLERIFKKDAENVEAGFTVLVSLLLAIGIFFIFPSLLFALISRYIHPIVFKNLIEGIIRMAIFILYIYIISRMKDIKRVFQYHGAEHKSIFCYENLEELTVENARKYTTLHPRCGTNFLFIVMLVSIFVYSFLGWQRILIRILLRIVMLPVVAGISYEMLRFLGRSKSKFVHTLAYPGLLLQKLTTAEPDDGMLEVAIAALNAVLEDTKGEDVQ